MYFRLLLYLIKFPLKDGIWFPIKVFNHSNIKIRKSATLNLNGRLFFGSSNRKKAIVSVAKTNFYLGYNSKTTIGNSVSIGPGVNIIVKDNANLKVGDGTYFTSDLHLEVCHNTKIGSNCAISWGVTIIDSDHHHIHYAGKKEKVNNIVEIGNNVWIGNNVIILKGTFIGDGSVVAAGSIVSGTFLPGSLIAGNPARPIKTEITWH